MPESIVNQEIQTYSTCNYCKLRIMIDDYNDSFKIIILANKEIVYGCNFYG